VSAPAWLEIRRGGAPLIISLPHTGTQIPAEIEAGLVSPWLARKDADWWVERLYAFAPPAGAAFNVALISHCDTCCVGIVIDTTAVPDPDVLLGCLHGGFTEVLALA